MTTTLAAPLSLLLPTTARAGCAPVPEAVVPPRPALWRGLAWAADIGGILLLGLVIPIGALIVGLPIALAVRGVLYLLGQL